MSWLEEKTFDRGSGVPSMQGADLDPILLRELVRVCNDPELGKNSEEAKAIRRKLGIPEPMKGPQHR